MNLLKTLLVLALVALAIAQSSKQLKPPTFAKDLASYEAKTDGVTFQVQTDATKSDSLTVAANNGDAVRDDAKWRESKVPVDDVGTVVPRHPCKPAVCHLAADCADGARLLQKFDARGCAVGCPTCVEKTVCPDLNCVDDADYFGWARDDVDANGCRKSCKRKVIDPCVNNRCPVGSLCVPTSVFVNKNGNAPAYDCKCKDPSEVFVWGFDGVPTTVKPTEVLARDHIQKQETGAPVRGAVADILAKLRVEADDKPQAEKDALLRTISEFDGSTAAERVNDIAADAQRGNRKRQDQSGDVRMVATDLSDDKKTDIVADGTTIRPSGSWNGGAAIVRDDKGKPIDAVSPTLPVRPVGRCEKLFNVCQLVRCAKPKDGYMLVTPEFATDVKQCCQYKKISDGTRPPVCKPLRDCPQTKPCEQARPFVDADGCPACLQAPTDACCPAGQKAVVVKQVRDAAGDFKLEEAGEGVLKEVGVPSYVTLTKCVPIDECNDLKRDQCEAKEACDWQQRVIVVNRPGKPVEPIERPDGSVRPIDGAGQPRPEGTSVFIGADGAVTVVKIDGSTESVDSNGAIATPTDEAFSGRMKPEGGRKRLPVAPPSITELQRREVAAGVSPTITRDDKGDFVFIDAIGDGRPVPTPKDFGFCRAKPVSPPVCPVYAIKCFSACTVRYTVDQRGCKIPTCDCPADVCPYSPADVNCNAQCRKSAAQVQTEVKSYSDAVNNRQPGSGLIAPAEVKKVEDFANGGAIGIDNEAVRCGFCDRTTCEKPCPSVACKRGYAPVEGADGCLSQCQKVNEECPAVFGCRNGEVVVTEVVDAEVVKVLREKMMLPVRTMEKRLIAVNTTECKRCPIDCSLVRCAAPVGCRKIETRPGACCATCVADTGVMTRPVFEVKRIRMTFAADADTETINAALKKIGGIVDFTETTKNGKKEIDAELLIPSAGVDATKEQQDASFATFTTELNSIEGVDSVALIDDVTVAADASVTIASASMAVVVLIALAL